jgi:putative DNA primase/helicase
MADRPPRNLPSAKSPEPEGGPMKMHEDGVPIEYSDEALALRFTHQFSDELRHCNQLGGWHYWNGMHWTPDITNIALDYARRTCRAASQDAQLSHHEESTRKKIATRMASERSAKAILGLAKADRKFARHPDQFDTDPWLLNTPAYTINLKTNERYPHRREDLITKSTLCADQGSCPRFMEFLDQITRQNVDLQSYLQLMAGYFLTGDTSCHAMFFLYGPGGNGKSLLIGLFQRIMADYGLSAPISMLTAQKHESHSTEIARLKGARLVVASEPGEEQFFAAAKIKLLTGGDKLAARQLYKEAFEFYPEFKLMVVGNHAPNLLEVDDGMKRRFKIIPLTFKPEQPDPGLMDTLSEEVEGILAWMLEGTRRYIEGEGLVVLPEVAAKATDEYFETEDTVGTWIHYCCDVDATAQTAVRILYDSYKDFCDGDRVHPLGKKGFSTDLINRGYTPFRTARERCVRRLVLRDDPNAPACATPPDGDPRANAAVSTVPAKEAAP